MDCGGNILAPGFIDIQINGAFGVDFSYDVQDEVSGAAVLEKVGRGILAHGVTSFCPTVVTSPPSVYHQVFYWLTVCCAFCAMFNNRCCHNCLPVKEASTAPPTSASMWRGPSSGKYFSFRTFCVICVVPARRRREPTPSSTS